MSANIYCRPTSFTGTSVPAYAPQAFMEILEGAFGNKCPTLSEDSLIVLRAMKVATNDSQMKKCFEVVISEIEKHGEIEIYATY